MASVSAFGTRLGSMLDIQFIREHADVVKESQRKRGESVELVDEVLRSDEVRRSSLKEFEAARAQQKEIGKKVAAAPADEKAKLIAATKELSQKVSEYKAAADAAAEEYTTAMWKLSNIVEPEAPEGGEDDYVVVKKVGQIRDFAAEGFEPKDHLTLGRGVAGIDMERGVKVGGSRFYFLRGQVARMQIAMLTMAVDQAEEHGFTLAITPTLVRPEVMRGTGFLNSHADEIYRLREPDDQYLVGTSEVALAGMHENEILNLENGPLRYCGWSSCYRREAGAAGKDTSGIIRVHQFDKVEMFVYAKQEDSYKEHEHLLAMEQEIIFLSIQDFVVPLCPSMARQMLNLLYFRWITIRFVSIRLEVLNRIAPTKAKFYKCELKVRMDAPRYGVSSPFVFHTLGHLW